MLKYGCVDSRESLVTSIHSFIRSFIRSFSSDCAGCRGGYGLVCALRRSDTTAGKLTAEQA